MRGGHLALKWVLLALGVAAVHFVVEQASLFAAMAGAVSPVPLLGSIMGSLFGLLSLPCGLLLHTPIAGMFEFPSYGYLVLTTTNSLMWGSAIAFLVRGLRSRRARTSEGSQKR